MYDNRVYFTRIGEFTWRESDCEELVGSITGDSPRLNSFSRLNGFEV